nr:DNA helicase [Tanacetum cinerariifolium]
DTHNEVSNRMRHFSEGDPSQLDPEFVSTLICLLDEHIKLVRLFRAARDRVKSGYVSEFHIRLFSVVGAREYDMPTSGTLGAIVFKNGPNTRTDYDVIIESRGGFPQRVNKLHPSYMGGRLFQQYVGGVFCSIEQNRLDFYMLYHNDIRREYISGIHDAISRGDREGSQVGDPPADTNNGSIQIEEIQNYIDGRFICPHEACWRILKYDIHGRQSAVQILSMHVEDLYMNDPELEGSVLYEVEVILKNYYKTVADFWLPPLSPISRDALKNRELMEKKSYNKAELAKEVAISVPKLNSDQKAIYDMRTLINNMCSEGKIVLVVASSGIASLLLPAGRTAHSRFTLPLDLTDESLCNIKKNTNAMSLLAKTSLIIWDESPMNNRSCFKALDKTLRDVLDALEKLFGSKTIVLGGDFRQTLPVKKGASKPMIVSASIAASDLWPHFKVCKLTENMCLLQPGLNKYEKTRVANFASWLLELGDGNMTVNYISDLKPGAKKILEAKVYRKWTNRSPPKTAPTDYCCILIDRELDSKVHTKGGHLSKTQPALTGNMTVNYISDLKPGAKKILEAKVYRKWKNRSPPKTAPTDYCCILIDREGNAMQENMGTGDIPYFESLLQEGSVAKWLQNLKGKSLKKWNNLLSLLSVPVRNIAIRNSRDSLLLQPKDTWLGRTSGISVRFTCEATITNVITFRYWYYQSCNDCIGKVYDRNDQSATASITFFTPNADVLIGSSCTELVKKYGVPNLRKFPDE